MSKKEEQKDLQALDVFVEKGTIAEVGKTVYPKVKDTNRRANLVRKRLHKKKALEKLETAIEDVGLTPELIALKLKALIEKKVQVEKYHTIPLSDEQGNILYDRRIVNGEEKLVPLQTIATRVNQNGKEVPIKIIEEGIDEKSVVKGLEIFLELFVHSEEEEVSESLESTFTDTLKEMGTMAEKEALRLVTEALERKTQTAEEAPFIDVEVEEKR